MPIVESGPGTSDIHSDGDASALEAFEGINGDSGSESAKTTGNDYDWDDQANPADGLLDDQTDLTQSTAKSETPKPGAETAATGTQTKESAAGIGQALSPELLAKAAYLGFTQQDMVELGSVKALEAAVRRSEALAQRGQQTQATQKPAEQPAPEATKFQIDRKKLVEELGYDENLVAEFEKLNAHYEKKFQETEANRVAQEKYLQDLGRWAQEQHQRNEQREQQRANEAWEQERAALTEKLPRQYREILQDPTEKAKHDDAIKRVALGYYHANQTLPPNDQIFHEALAMAFGNKLQTVAREQVRDALAQRNGATVSRTNGRGASTESGTGDAAAVRFIRGFKGGRG